MCSPTIEKFGATPANIQWTVVRGDTGTFRVDFLENDEVTFFDTSEWTFEATAYDPQSDVLDQCSRSRVRIRALTINFSTFELERINLRTFANLQTFAN